MLYRSCNVLIREILAIPRALLKDVATIVIGGRKAGKTYTY